jgi:hypothetical protein
MSTSESSRRRQASARRAMFQAMIFKEGKVALLEDNAGRTPAPHPPALRWRTLSSNRRQIVHSKPSGLETCGQSSRSAGSSSRSRSRSICPRDSGRFPEKILRLGCGPHRIAQVGPVHPLLLKPELDDVLRPHSLHRVVDLLVRFGHNGKKFQPLVLSGARGRAMVEQSLDLRDRRVVLLFSAQDVWVTKVQDSGAWILSSYRVRSSERRSYCSCVRTRRT